MAGTEPRSSRSPAQIFHQVLAPRGRAACFIVGVIVLTWVYATSPTSGRGLAAYTSICVGATAAVLWGVRRYRPSDRSAWYLVAGAPLLGGIGMALRQTLAGRGGFIVSLIPDLVTIPAYLLFGAGLLRFLRARRGADAGSAFDGGLMAVAAFLVSWSTLISPLLNDADLTASEKFLNGAYPTISVAILFVGALLAMTEVTRIPVFWTLALAWVGLITGDLVYSLGFVGIETLPLWAANCAYCGFFGLLGAAGLLPSMVSLSRPAAKRVRGYGHSRFVAVAVALMVPAIVVAIRSPAGPVERLVNGGLLAVLGILVLFRTAWAVNRHATSEVRLELQANRDPLTGLPNRLRLASHLEDVLARAHVAGEGVGVLFMDLDQFKNVNDSWGHETGDELLIVVAGRLDAAVRRGELVARVGGDEFIIVCEGLDDVDGLASVADRMLTIFDDPVALRACDVVITSSVGIAFTKPSLRDDVTAEDLIREADTAMYRSKARGGHAVVLFDESMRTEIAERIALESSLRGALERGELRMHYQPIVDLHSGATTGFEALMRWKHPERGMIPPSDFIPVAEDTGLILKLGRWAIEEASSQLGTWRTQFGTNLSMSVNLSLRQMRDPHLVSTVRTALEETGLPGGALCLEITESTLLEDVEATTATIDALKRLGVRLSADDFGTGYSSLAYLRLFPFDQVKVDRSFVAGLDGTGDDDVIVGAVLSMARALSLSTVAEGVETVAQRDRLIALGAEGAQGWLFSHPLPAELATQHLRSLYGEPALASSTAGDGSATVSMVPVGGPAAG